METLVAGGRTLCGHDSAPQRILLADEPGRSLWCGECWATYRDLVTEYKDDRIDQTALRYGLDALIRGFSPHREGGAPTEAEIHLAVAEAVADIEGTIHAA